MISDIFCKIISGELKADVVWQDDDFLVINDIVPQAPVHLLIIPKRHIEGTKDLKEVDDAMIGKAFRVAEIVAQQLSISEKGYRLILNEGDHGGKFVPHFHIHLLGGKRLGAKIVRE